MLDLQVCARVVLIDRSAAEIMPALNAILRRDPQAQQPLCMKSTGMIPLVLLFMLCRCVSVIPLGLAFRNLVVARVFAFRSAFV